MFSINSEVAYAKKQGYGYVVVFDNREDKELESRFALDIPHVKHIISSFNRPHILFDKVVDVDTGKTVSI